MTKKIDINKLKLYIIKSHTLLKNLNSLEELYNFIDNLIIISKIIYPQIKCKKGCTLCCKTGSTPIFEIEWQNIKLFLDNTEKENLMIIRSRFEENFLPNRDLFESYELDSGERLKIFVIKNTISCPFLNSEENKCDIYNIRPLRCRTFGLFVRKELFINNTTGERFHGYAVLTCSEEIRRWDNFFKNINDPRIFLPIHNYFEDKLIEFNNKIIINHYFYT